MARRSPTMRDTKDRVLAAALDVFSDRGYSAASIEEIAARAGLTKGAVYYYFRDKHDLATDLHRQLWSSIADEAIAAFDPQADVVTNLKQALRRCLDALREHAHARVFLREFWQVPDLDVAGRQQQDVGGLQVQHLVEQGIADGVLAPLDPGTMTSALLGAFAETTLHVLSGGRPEDAFAVLETLVDGFAARPAGARLEGVAR